MMFSLAMEMASVIFLTVSSADGTRVSLSVRLIGHSGFLPYMSSKGVNPVDSLGELLIANSAA